jgi:hypothetical protein
MEPADHDMYRAAIHGDLEAFELVIRNMSRPLFAIAFGALQNREEAEDVVQDAFVKTRKARWHVRNPEKFPAWIATIVRNPAHDILMRRRTIPMEEQFNELPSDQAQFWLAERANDWCCAGVSCALDYRAGCGYRHRPRRPSLPPPSRKLGTQASGLCAKRTFCPLFSRQTAECNSAGLTDWKVCVPPLVAGPSCSKHSSIVK